MNTPAPSSPRRTVVLLLAGIVMVVHPTPLRAQTTAFTYQGELTENGGPANGFYDLRFAIYDSTNSPGTVIAGPITKSAVAVSNGVFTVVLDFGAGAFNGGDRWLEMGVETNDGGGFTSLSPRQRLTASPYAIYAASARAAGLSGAIPASSLSGTYGNAVTLNNAGNSFSGNGAGLANVNAVTLGGVNANGFWRTAGNAGTTPGLNFIGTADNQELQLRVDDEIALRVQPTPSTPNWIGGYSGNTSGPGVRGAVIAGGGAAGALQSVDAQFSTIGGGSANAVKTNAFNSVIGGGDGNTIQTNAYDAVIGGGVQNSILSGAQFATIGGGAGSTIEADAYYSTIGGGTKNYIGWYYSTVGGGAANTNTASWGTIGGGINNAIRTGATAAIIPGGERNEIQDVAYRSAIGGGDGNTIQPFAHESVIAGGYTNTIGPSAVDASIGGGSSNYVGGSYAVVPGGLLNVANGKFSFAAGQNARALDNGAFVWADTSSTSPFSSTAPNQFLVRADGGFGIGTTNPQAQLHLYSTANPATVRIQSTGTPGLGRIEFVSDPQGSASEWRPAFIQSTDAGGFTGGLAFYVNGAGSGNKFGTNEVMRLVNGRVGIGVTNPANIIQVAGGAYCTGTTWVDVSDRNAKKDFHAVNALNVLDEVLQLPVETWQYTNDTPTVRHIGPVAQDFHDAFGVGADDRHIASLDANGVALAAIQGLNQKVEKVNAALRAENAALKSRLEKLEGMFDRLQGVAK